MLDVPTPVSEHLPPAHSEEPPSYELEIELRGWKKALAWLKTWKGICAMVAVALLLVAVWQAPALYRASKVWRAARLVAQCEEAASRNDEAGELRALRQAFALLPSTPLTYRALARYHERRGESLALGAYEKLFATGEATPDDAARACQIAALRGDPVQSRAILEHVRRDPATRELSATLALQARQLAMEGSWETALAVAQQAVERASDGGVEKIVRANILLQAAERGPEERRAQRATQAVDVFAQLAQRMDEPGIEALSALIALARQPAARPLLAGRDVSGWVEGAARHPKASPRLRVAAWNLQLAANAAEAEKFFTAFLAHSRDAPAPQRLEGARWLNQHGKFALSLELSRPEKDTSEEWFLVVLDALAGGGDWKGVLELLDARTGQAAALPGALRLLFQMRARAELRVPFDAGEVWRDIQVQVQGEPARTQLYVAQYAEKVGEARQAASIYRRLLDEAASPTSFERQLPKDARLVCHTGLIRAMPPTASATDVLPLVEALLADFPELEEARNDAAYLRLLTGGVSEALGAEVAARLRRQPALLAYRTTAALYEMRRGRFSAAAQLYEGWKIDWSTAADRFRVVRAAVFEAVGQRDEAAAMRETIQLVQLRPEEAALLK
jgi:hypothetical protein